MGAGIASAWGLSWGLAWNGAWGDMGDSPPPPTPPTPSDPWGFGYTPSGGFPSDSGPTKEQTRRSRILHGIEKEVVEAVATRQAKSSQDDLQRKEELLAELRIRKIEARAEHFSELVRIREALIENIRKQDEDAAAMMIMLAAVE